MVANSARRYLFTYFSFHFRFSSVSPVYDSPSRLPELLRLLYNFVSLLPEHIASLSLGSEVLSQITNRLKPFPRTAISLRCKTVSFRTYDRFC